MVSLMTKLRVRRFGVRIPAGGGRDFFRVLNAQTHSASYSMGTGALSPAVKRSGREADHSPRARAEVKN